MATKKSGSAGITQQLSGEHFRYKKATAIPCLSSSSSSIGNTSFTLLPKLPGKLTFYYIYLISLHGENFLLFHKLQFNCNDSNLLLVSHYPCCLDIAQCQNEVALRIRHHCHRLDCRLRRPWSLERVQGNIPSLPFSLSISILVFPFHHETKEHQRK